MAESVDLIVHGAGHLLTPSGKEPRRGREMSELGSIRNGAVAIADGRFVALGPSPEIRSLLLILDVEDHRHLSYRFGTNLVQTVIKRGKIVFTSQAGPFASH